MTGYQSKRAAAQDKLEQEPVDFASLLREAEEIVQNKPTWKRFIDGTPLANDIAVWMAVFAQDFARRTAPPQRTWVDLTDEETSELWEISRAALPRYVTYASLVKTKLKEKNNG